MTRNLHSPHDLSLPNLFLSVARTILGRNENLWWYFNSKDPGSADDYCTLDPEVGKSIIDYVPRLLTQYASLLETSYALTEGWEAYVKANPPKKLYLPDHR